MVTESRSPRAREVALHWGRPAPEAATGRRRRVRRGLVGTLLFASCLYIYTVVQDVSVPIYSAESRWDADIPLIPEFIFIYWMFFPFVVVAAFTARAEDFFRIVVGALLAAVVGWLSFLAFPASLTRPDPASLEPGVVQWLFSLLHWVDDSHNTFPSLHVSTTWICLLAFRGSRWRWAAVGAVLIVISTLFVKQHTLLDVAGGTVLAAFVVPIAVPIGDRLYRLLAKPREL